MEVETKNRKIVINWKKTRQERQKRELKDEMRLKSNLKLRSEKNVKCKMLDLSITHSSF
jgi:hypothetical protein